MMLTDNKLKVLRMVIDGVILAIILSIFFSLYLNIEQYSKYNHVLDKSRLPPDMGVFRFTVYLLTFITLLKIYFVRIIYIIIFFYLRNVVIGIIREDLFANDISIKLKKISKSLLIAASLFFFGFLTILILTSTVNSNKEIRTLHYIGLLLEVFQSFLLPALIIYCISEVFIYAAKLKQENDLTI